ncbi:MoaD/ThiS family protein [Dictyoglomus thermophilum]|uniref:ThiS family, putative n=2 Tax=Dictyoglomus thermophilum TaxID=14 RepID=B5YAA8_DICT6|nr:MoaD/ThiS family protein [Dictyoglomus thermophilum]ACI19018.1 ThiS family, putative [Dictyoglomus thermophilum H-6-12]MCX7720429.1 MoaD/ThiS family protein [Dictyoglomus thermophilum]TYT24432.1 MoaD/ThiS family protein [Dictyoglomus thermophilum]
MRVILRRNNEVKEMEGDLKVSEILKILNINPETVLVVRGEEILTPDKIVKNNEEVEIIPVISGGR